MEGFFPRTPAEDMNKFSVLALAHVGDAVYELLVRSAICAAGPAQVNDLHKRTVAMVCAPAQAAAVKRLLPKLTAEESAVYKRGRNAKVNSVPQHAEIGEYHAATGFEALLGWLYLQGRTERIEELFRAVLEDTENAT